MALPNIIPWEPSHVPAELQSELNRRKKNISLNYVSANGTWKNGDWEKYTGPMTAWVRMCSNGRGRRGPGIEAPVAPLANLVVPNFPRKRFVFFGGKDFQSTYGFKNTEISPHSQIIGHMPNGTPHIIDNARNSEYPIHVPAPEIVRVDMTIQKELLRRATIEWTCFSWKQLEYMTPYFLVPGITCMVEMGWNHFNPDSLVNLTDENGMRKLWENPYPLYEKNIIDSKGNYDVIYGMITNFNWSVDGNNRYTCTTEITSKNRLYAGLPVNSELFERTRDKKKDGSGGEPDKTMGNLSEFFNSTQLIQNFRTLAKQGTSKFFKSKKEGVISPETAAERAEAAKTTAKLAGSFSVAGAGSAGAIIAADTISGTPSITEPTTLDYTFFKDVYNQILAIPDKEKQKLKLSYLYGVFDGRDPSELAAGKNLSKNQTDFDSNTASDTKVWINMGLLSIIINTFSNRPGSTDKSPMFQLDIDEVIISAHPNLISANGGIMLIPNARSPKFFWGRQEKREILKAEQAEVKRGAKFYRDFSGPGPDHAYETQYVETKDSNDPADRVLKNILDQQVPARDDIDVWINRNVYRLNPSGIQSAEDEDTNYSPPPVRGSHAFPNRSITGELKPCGYLRDIYYNLANFKQIIKEPNVKSYYDLVQRIIKDLNGASAGFWDLHMADNGIGSWTITDHHFISSRNGRKGSTLTFDMHDANNIVKSFKFRPTMTDSQTTRVLYGDISNRNSQFYSREEIESVDFIFKDSFLYNDNDSYNKSSTAANPKFDEIWKNTLEKIQVIDQDASDTLQMKIQRNLYPDIETSYFRKFRPGSQKLFRYIKLALPSDIGASVLRRLLDDEDYVNNSKYCAIQPGINAEITMQGLGGLRTFQCFLIRNLPEPYSHKDIIFQVINVMDHMESGNWETTIVAGIRPLRAYIKNVLGIDKPS